ncbi:class I adenylate-forming enzyme family protein [Actinoalloteichus caeruleus]|uniref:Amino acid adenylation domain-containing protein n=1 Tax=Actinoalloteichus caeruleus DSM 43889 TaxID=1120930 RepID=A0ABT1JCV9_ACTCY|nr:AMP-binding protein [Actinoalloteichus caeruleus]MCP2330324.1 amino acid adenylation domain-containing protein [Actinoalloteichus caeruleus DSM 43889]
MTVTGQDTGPLHTLVDTAAARRPTASAVHDVDGTWTYAELAAASREYADHLVRSGARPGDRVAIRASARAWVLAALYACSRAGVAAVLLNPEAPPQRLERITSDAEPTLVLTEPPPTTGGPRRPPTPPRAPDPDTAAILLYTSGSTSEPKAVVCPHRAVMFAVRAIGSTLGYRADDVILCRLPLSFDYGLYQALLAARVGAAVVLRGPGDDAGLLATIRRHEVTVVPVVPPLAAVLTRLGRRAPAPSVRLLTNTGQELTPTGIEDLRRTFPTAAVRLMYGITECKRVTIAEADSDLVRPGSLGTPLPGTSVSILDPAGRPVPAGTEGEIVVSGPHVMAGYWRDESLTTRTFGRDPRTGERLLRTGDHGRLDSDGHLYFHGRRDDIFKQRGVRTSAAEIEAAARQVPEVTDAVVVPPAGGRDAVLFAVTELGSHQVLRELRRFLEAAKVPATCRTLPAFPVAGTGKTDRAALRALAAERETACDT